jgi:predicted enzyme related to lactoylglutathione lyase
MNHPVVHFEVIGKDDKKLQAFYAELFGWKIDVDNEMRYGMVDTGANGAGIRGGVGAAGDTGASYSTFYVQSDDLQASLDKAEELGGKTTTPPMQLPMGISIAMFEDPEGHLVGLVTPPPDAS